MLKIIDIGFGIVLMIVGALIFKHWFQVVFDLSWDVFDIFQTGHTQNESSAYIGQRSDENFMYVLWLFAVGAACIVTGFYRIFEYLE